MASNSAVLTVVTTQKVTIVGPKAKLIADYIADKIDETQNTYSGDNVISLEDIGEVELRIETHTEGQK